MSEYILITGGAGYIGSHINKHLSKLNYSTVILDSLINGNKEAVKWGNFVECDLSDIEGIKTVFQQYRIKAVIHMAAFAYVGESILNPEKYYINNVSNTLNLLKVMNEFKCDKIIFSSSCATYGEPNFLPITEAHTQVPINPYGQSKLIVEKIIKDYSKAYNLKYVILRYFNAAGADFDCEIGEKHIPETHLIPLIMDVAVGRKENIQIFGTDYNTEDGTAVRDYIHVNDLAEAHVKAMQHLLEDGNSEIFNLGVEKGYSVKQIIQSIEKITGIKIKTIGSPRRIGDPAVLIANAVKAREILNWIPESSNLDQIIKSAWEWHKKLYFFN